MMDFIYSADWAVFQWVEKYIWGGFLDVVMKIITQLGDAGIVWIVCAIVFLFFKKTRKAGAMIGVALVVMMVCNDLALKELFARPRPYNYEPWLGIFNYPNIVPPEESFSFPSGHTSSSFAAATVIAYMFRKKGIPAVVLAALIGFSRIYVHVHYCSDVLAGIAVGIVYGVIGILLVSLVWGRIEKLFVGKKQAKCENERISDTDE